LGVISFVGAKRNRSALARFQFDLVLRGFVFSAQFSAFDGIPLDRANLFIAWFFLCDLPPVQQIFARRNIFEFKRAIGASVAMMESKRDAAL